MKYINKYKRKYMQKTKCNLGVTPGVVTGVRRERVKICAKDRI